MGRGTRIASFVFSLINTKDAILGVILDLNQTQKSFH